MLLPFCAVSVFFSFRVPAFLLLVLVVVHFIERLRFSFGVPSFSFRMILFLSALGLFVRLVPPCLFFVPPAGLLLSVWRVSLLFAAVSLSGLCVISSCAPSFSVVGFAGSSPPFVCFLRFRLLSRSFVRYALLCFVVLVLVVAGSVVVCCSGLFTFVSCMVPRFTFFLFVCGVRRWCYFLSFVSSFHSSFG